MTRGSYIRSEASSMPYRLRGILRKHGIQSDAIRKRLVFDDGTGARREMSAPTFSLLMTRHQWPKTLDQAHIKAVIADALREANVPEADVAAAWELDTANPPSAAPAGELPPIVPTNLDGTQFLIPEAEMLSSQARDHFRLSANPFVNDVQGPSDVYLSKDQRYIRETMYYAAKHSGFVAIVGESGSGKTTLRRDLLDRIKRESDQIVVIQPQTVDKTVLTAAHICDAIVADLSTEAPKLSLEAKGRQVQRILAGGARLGNAHCLIIEEAHDLSIATLKYLKRFWEMEDGFRKLLGIILVGQPELGMKLDVQRNPDAREVINRIEVAKLKSLNGNLEEYLALKFKRVGLGLDDVFERDAFDAMRMRLTRRHANGTTESHLYPLIVHNLCIKAMNQAVDLGLPKVNAKLLEKV